MINTGIKQERECEMWIKEKEKEKEIERKERKKEPIALSEYINLLPSQ